MTAAQIFFSATLPVIVSMFVAVWINSHQLSEMSKRIDDLRSDFDVRITDLREFIRSEIKRLEQRIERLEHPVVIHQK